MTPSAVSEALSAALRAVPRLRVYTDPGAVVDPPAAIVGPPVLLWDGFHSDPTTATYRVGVVVANDKRATERLWELLPLVAAAIDSVPDAVAVRAEPVSFNAGGVELPGYDVTVEASL